MAMTIPDGSAWGRLDRCVRSHENDLCALTERLVAFPTPCPPGRNTEAIQGFLAELLRGWGAEVQTLPLYPGDLEVVARVPGRSGGRSLLINGHVDVAATEPGEAWSHPPFAPVRRDGRIYGRGTSDMKGGIAAALTAVQAVLEHGGPGGDIILHLVTGEEMGEGGTLLALEHTPPAEFALVPEPTAGDVSLGQGGVVTGWITIQSPQTYHDAARRRMIHAGGGLDAASAIEKMTKVLIALQELERHWAVVKSHPGFPPGTTTLNPSVIEGGRHPAFVADRCALWVTVHFYPGETAREVTAEIERTILAAAAADPWLHRNPPSFRWGGRSMIEDRGETFPAFETDPRHPGVDVLERAHRDVHGSSPNRRMSGGVCDAGWLAAHGIPSVIYGPGGREQAHTVNESVSAADLVACARVYARVIDTWGSG